MSRQQHPVLPEELMAYIDGELAADRAAMAAKHLETCSECQYAVDNAARLSREMSEWHVEAPTQGLDTAVLAEVKRHFNSKSKAESRFTWWGRNRSWAYALSAVCAALLVVVMVMTPSRSMRSLEGPMFDDAMTQSAEMPAEPARATSEGRGQRGGNFREGGALEEY